MANLHPTNATSNLPESLSLLRELSFNFLWSWDPQIARVFEEADPHLWDETDHNPIKVWERIGQGRLRELAGDSKFLHALRHAYQRYENYLQTPTWFDRTFKGAEKPLIAYFSPEYGITECLPTYSGGLGILSGDHIKTSSDLGLPLVGVGLFYHRGYFKQSLNEDGWQGEEYPENGPHTVPVEPVRDTAGQPLTISVAFPGRQVQAQILEAKVGRVSLLLLDTNIPTNTPEDRRATHQLYGGDLETRIQQEILLGIGGVRALHAVGVRPSVCHMNEGHSAFQALERIRRVMVEDGVSFDEARRGVVAGNVFTTHTPVQAGVDLFPRDLVESYFGDYYPKLGLNLDVFLRLGQGPSPSMDDHFNMAILALRLSSHRNAVSRLHEQVSRRMWAGVWEGKTPEEAPITSVSNGVHVSSWVSESLAEVFDHYIGPGWRADPADKAVWEGVEKIPDRALWETHVKQKELLASLVGGYLRAEQAKRGGMDPAALTVGFARRFTGYKRATLLLRDPERLLKVIADPTRPVQFIFAGKAHPRDVEGKEFIKEIIRFSRREGVGGRVVFLGDYNIGMARRLVQGVDVWLNTPRRPLEASGTSGMKAAVNGGLNLSVLDGWWNDAYQPGNGWAIGGGEEYGDYDHQDQVEASLLYDLLEREVAPLYYARVEREGANLPLEWISRMKRSMRTICPIYNSHRMVREYAERFYLPPSPLAS